MKTIVVYLCILFGNHGNPDVVVTDLPTLEDCLAVAQAYKAEGGGRNARCVEVKKRI